MCGRVSQLNRLICRWNKDTSWAFNSRARLSPPSVFPLATFKRHEARHTRNGEELFQLLFCMFSYISFRRKCGLEALKHLLIHSGQTNAVRYTCRSWIKKCGGMKVKQQIHGARALAVVIGDPIHLFPHYLSTILYRRILLPYH